MVKRHYIFLTICILTISTIASSQSVKISGILTSREEGKVIYNGVVFLRPGNQATTSNPGGEYSFTTFPGMKQINTQVIGYKPVIVRFEARSDTIVNIELQVSPFELSEVTITGDSIKNAGITPLGSFILTPAAVHQIPKLFSEPDLLKSFQFLPGVVSGRDGTSDIYVRGGSPGQNIVIADGCYFFLPGHLLGVVSPYDLDFLESAELYKDYFPAEIGGGASSVISLDFRKPHSDSLRAQLRLGLLSSGITIETPLKKIKWDLTAGLKRGNYSLYAPLLKKIVSSDVGDFLPPDKYSFYDGFIRLSHYSSKWGDLSYLFFGNYDNGREENSTTGQTGDTLIKYVDGISTGWNNMVHALRWKLPVKSAFSWKIDLNYNRLSMGRKIYMEYEKFLNGSQPIESGRTMFRFSPVINTLGTTISASKTGDRLRYTAGISHRFRYFSPNNFASNTIGNKETRNEFSSKNIVDESAIFFSSTALLTRKLQMDAGLRISYVITRESGFLISEPRLRFSFNNGGIISPHINYVRLAQNDHSAEGSNAGLRTMIWLPLYKELGPEISDVVSAGFQGQVNNDFIWSIDGYYKRTSGMVDYKPGASFIFDTSFVDMLDRVEGRAYGLETGIVKRKGDITGSASYTYSRSKREWGAPEGLIWIPSASDRPHSFNLSLKYHFKERTSFGLNFVYQSGAPATIYMHNTSYGEFFETKNNIRYFDYHRLDLSVRHIIYKRRISIFLDADVYNVYNHKNTFYFKETWDETEQRYYFKNISLFPVMPSLTVTIKY
jgi:hypothetical protein